MPQQAGVSSHACLRKRGEGAPARASHKDAVGLHRIVVLQALLIRDPCSPADLYEPRHRPTNAEDLVMKLEKETNDCLLYVCMTHKFIEMVTYLSVEDSFRPSLNVAAHPQNEGGAFSSLHTASWSHYCTTSKRPTMLRNVDNEYSKHAQ
ncbi:hypothetical protein K461DRAFT_140840 [Myriangium duriaei CBS 260.36]|uniref:Uncharacterized protein n=1 Tax=Myriangium duriaei CBS 260.36 TaxID=1168546 RepID=A0A9P4J2W4_9PEZI|nr:hypothetical protein K461DRAFT_140840 [Myriangium duriaei CBS 260.36]